MAHRLFWRVMRTQAGLLCPLHNATAYPSTTPTASATPQGVVATAKSVVNVRTGPGDIYPVIGQLKKGEQAELVGASTSNTPNEKR